MAATNILIYLLRHDLRVADNPILHRLVTSEHGFTHVLPVYVFPAHQMEISGLIRDGSKSPYPEARSEIGKFWRCGPHRTKFIAQSVWNLKGSLNNIGSGLSLRAGMFGDIANDLLQGFADNKHKVGAVWMTAEESVEEKKDEQSVSAACVKHGVDFKLWVDEKYFIDDRDLGFDKPSELADIFTSFRKTQEPLREKPRPTLSPPQKGSIPPLPEQAIIPTQRSLFEVPSNYHDLETALLKPLTSPFSHEPPFPEGAHSVHPFKGGEDEALTRLRHLVKSGAMTNYKDTRNGLLGVDFSTKLSAYLSLGCLTSRQIHEALLQFEDGRNEEYKDTAGYGKGENDGTKAVRFELLWRDYMRLCTRKFKGKLFRVTGFKTDDTSKWKRAGSELSGGSSSAAGDEISKTLLRFFDGTTGMGLIDASQRELIHTGYTSNRARQNVASFLTKHLSIDWRYGAEWYEYLLVDYDVSSNWSNWQYVAGVGNDPRGDNRIFNPVKQAFDYDKDGAYVKSWVVETRKLDKLENVFQICTTSQEELSSLGLTDNIMVTSPIKKIDFSVARKPNNNPRRHFRRAWKGGSGAHNNGGNQGPEVSNGHPLSPQSPNHGSGSHDNKSPPDGPKLRGDSGHRGGGHRGGRGRGGSSPGGSRGGGYMGGASGGSTGGGYRGGGPGYRAGGSGRGYSTRGFFNNGTNTPREPQAYRTAATPGSQM